ncbi:response regulator transcription factor [Allofournierella sp.]|uniref:response regulator transcription factor n=1 Tax=Allofournierella sp. TaxID=1940256 RepID=UPI003AB7C652
MYKIILVDDERPTLEMLENYIDWKKMQGCVVATAHNGRNALEKIEALQPDIVFTDVKMPVMDGIELCKQVHARFPGIQIVFLSGYNEFEYACAALQHGACGYLLKPVDPEELAEIMKKVCWCCEEHKDRQNSLLSTANEYMRELLQLGGNLLPGLASEVASAYNRHLHLSSANENFDFVFITIDEYALLTDYAPGIDTELNQFSIVERLELFISGLPNYLPGVLIKLRDGQWLFSTQTASCAEFKNWRGQNAEAQRWISLFFTACPLALPAFTEQFPQLVAARKQMLFVWGTGLTVEDWRNVQLPQGGRNLPPIERLIGAIQQNLRSTVEQWLEEFYDIGLAGGTLGRALAETISVFKAVSSALVSNNHYLQNAIEQDSQFLGRLSRMESLQSMKMLMRQILSMILDALESSAADRHLEIANQVRHIVERDYGQALSLDSLAELVFLSPNYLSSVFKETTGKTLLEYVTEVRMRNACRMLAQSNIKIHEVAKRVGYESPSYFGSVFLKRTGLTPNQYRVRAQGELKL